MATYLGLDFGTTGARSCVVNELGAILHQYATIYPGPDPQNPDSWRQALLTLLSGLPGPIAQEVARIAIDATSATVLLCDSELSPISPALPYFDSRALKEAAHLHSLAPPGHTACTPTSGLAKFLWLTGRDLHGDAAYFMHQADWLAALLTGQGGLTDYHNALKTGYDTENLAWPDWVLRLPHTHLLPRVVPPGTPIATIHQGLSDHFGIDSACEVCAGTTDSIAAFIATGINEPGQAVTSLGTTIVLKLLSNTRVEAAEYGVYSHRYGNLWLAGGASNAGGSILRRFFSDEHLETLCQQIDPMTDSPLVYYPLTAPGERFPVNDPTLPPCLTPRPTDEVQFLHGLLQGLSRIEARGYAKLAELGATPLKNIFTCGGGARNATWARMRQRLTGVPVSVARQTDAAYGAALLAMRGGL